MVCTCRVGRTFDSVHFYQRFALLYLHSPTRSSALLLSMDHTDEIETTQHSLTHTRRHLATTLLLAALHCCTSPSLSLHQRHCATTATRSRWPSNTGAVTHRAAGPVPPFRSTAAFLVYSHTHAHLTATPRLSLLAQYSTSTCSPISASLLNQRKDMKMKQNCG